jgi:hypothetical protein
MEGDLGLPLPNQNPLCLKVTMSPGLSCHFEERTVVAVDATKLTPFGLHVIIHVTQFSISFLQKKKQKKREEERENKTYKRHCH